MCARRPRDKRRPPRARHPVPHPLVAEERRPIGRQINRLTVIRLILYVLHPLHAAVRESA